LQNLENVDSKEAVKQSALVTGNLQDPVQVPDCLSRSLRGEHDDKMSHYPTITEDNAGISIETWIPLWSLTTTTLQEFSDNE